MRMLSPTSRNYVPPASTKTRSDRSRKPFCPQSRVKGYLYNSRQTRVPHTRAHTIPVEDSRTQAADRHTADHAPAEGRLSAFWMARVSGGGAALAVTVCCAVFALYQVHVRLNVLEQAVLQPTPAPTLFTIPLPTSQVPTRAAASTPLPKTSSARSSTAKPTSTAVPATIAKCSVNPAVLYEGRNHFVPECPTVDIDVASDPTLAYPTHAYVLSLPSKMQAFHERRDFLRTFGIELERWPAVNGSATFNASEYGTMIDPKKHKTVRTWLNPQNKVLTREGAEDGFLTLGERGYLASMKKLFEHVLTKPEVDSVMVIDEDAVFDCNFREQLLHVLQQPRCGSIVSKKSSNGGVLVLGTSIWIESYGSHAPLKGWALTNADLKHSLEQFGEPPRCFNAHSKSFGSFAVIYHRDTFVNILQWLKAPTAPFDHIYPHLANRGHPVRIAYPFVAIQDVAHESSVDNRGEYQSNLLVRAKLHHWQLDRYCKPDRTPMLPS
eukprot:m.390021 g.390021  ORF g.390021 m.390021 type:complete len:494 (+) comp56338_c0_seq7:2743-4224(+)